MNLGGLRVGLLCLEELGERRALLKQVPAYSEVRQATLRHHKANDEHHSPSCRRNAAALRAEGRCHALGRRRPMRGLTDWPTLPTVQRARARKRGKGNERETERET
jgi:hypothetical protein